MKMGDNYYEIQGNELTSMTLVSETEVDKKVMERIAHENPEIIHSIDPVGVGQDWLLIQLEVPITIERTIKLPEE